MARAVITFKIMPESPDTNLAPVTEQAMALAREGGAMGQMQSKIEPIGYGLNAVLILGMFKVEGSEFDQIAEKMQKISGVQSAEVYKMDLALG